jgi:hypothetical protein
MARLVRLGKLAAPTDAQVPLESHEPRTSNWASIKEERTQAGKPWTAAEDAALLRDYDASVPLEQIAVHLHRGIHAVEVRLIKLGRHSGGTPVNAALS